MPIAAIQSITYRQVTSASLQVTKLTDFYRPRLGRIKRGVIMERGRIQSLKRRISRANDLTLSEIAQELISEGHQPPVEVFGALRERIMKGAYIDSRKMSKLIILSRDRDLYQIPHTKVMLHGNVEALVDLLRARIPDRAIEDRLCERLANDFEQNAYGFREFVLVALKDYGSIKCLDTLEAIDFDFHGRFQTAKTVDDALKNQPISQSMESPSDFGWRVLREVDVMLGKLLKEAITSVRERNFLGEDMWSEESKKPASKFHRANIYIDLARGHLSDDLGAALNNIRKATEYLLKSVIKLQAIQADKKGSIEEMQLPTLMAILMDTRNNKNPNKVIYQHLEVIQKLTTLGSHDQKAPIDEFVNRDMVVGLISTFKVVQGYFEKYVEEEI